MVANFSELKKYTVHISSKFEFGEAAVVGGGVIWNKKEQLILTCLSLVRQPNGKKFFNPSTITVRFYAVKKSVNSSAKVHRIDLNRGLALIKLMTFDVGCSEVTLESAELGPYPEDGVDLSLTHVLAVSHTDPMFEFTSHKGVVGSCLHLQELFETKIPRVYSDIDKKLPLIGAYNVHGTCDSNGSPLFNEEGKLIGLHILNRPDCDWFINAKVLNDFLISGDVGPMQLGNEMVKVTATPE